VLILEDANNGIFMSRELCKINMYNSWMIGEAVIMEEKWGF
jgi:hypothetical protein